MHHQQKIQLYSIEKVIIKLAKMRIPKMKWEENKNLNESFKEFVQFINSHNKLHYVLEKKFNKIIDRLAEDEYDGTSLVEFIKQIFDKTWKDIGAKPAWLPIPKRNTKT